MTQDRKLGIIAGQGALPEELVVCCRARNIAPYVVALKGFTDEAFLDGIDHVWVKLGQAGRIMSFFRENGVSDLVMIGAVKRPSWHEIRPDFKAVKILSRIGLTKLGDNGLLTALKAELEREGFSLCAVQDFMPDLLTPEGALGQYSFAQEDVYSITIGFRASQALGALDIGQSVVVQDGMVLAVEGVEGTDALIMRSASLQKKGRGAILVKSCKPHQDKSLDLPTIGAATVEEAYKAGFCGIVIEAGNVLVPNRKDVAECADRYKLFVQGVVLKDYI